MLILMVSPVFKLWPYCRHHEWVDEYGTVIEPTFEMLASVKVALYPESCKQCAARGYPYLVQECVGRINLQLEPA